MCFHHAELGYVTECIVCVPGYDPLIFSFLSFLLFDWVGVLWSQLSKVLKVVRWAHRAIVQELCESRGGRPVRPNEPSGFRGRKAILNHPSALVSACP